MTPDVTQLIEFYKSPLGQLVRRLLRRRVEELAGDVTGKRVLGLGFATPYLGFALQPAERVLAFMPARQGACLWPPGKPSLSVLCDPLELPLTDAAVDLVIAVHLVEHVADAEELMRELWRVCAPDAELIVVAPRRRGLWSTRDNTPFGIGHPYSRGQMERLLRAHSFEVKSIREALYLPPSHRRIILKSAQLFERFGPFFGPALSGVIVARARKKLFPAIARRKRLERFVRLPGMAPQTAMQTPDPNLG
jgi:SAM-dependent methyltransferase